MSPSCSCSAWPAPRNWDPPAAIMTRTGLSAPSKTRREVLPSAPTSSCAWLLLMPSSACTMPSSSLKPMVLIAPCLPMIAGMPMGTSLLTPRAPQLSKRAARTIGARLCANASATGQSLLL
eukprot:7976-Heterococcus_DN1.PRE.2